MNHQNARAECAGGSDGRIRGGNDVVAAGDGQQNLS